MRFDILTIFPSFFDGFLTHGVVRRALENGIVQCERRDLRDFTTDRHRTVDDRPFGGGEGMVLKPEPLAAAIESLDVRPKAERDRGRESVILLSAQGERFTQSVARELAQLERVVLICGRYEGVDERVNTLFCDRELSIGDYVLSGGEFPALVLLDALARLQPGALGDERSSVEESFETGLLDWPHYTRPEVFEGLPVPPVLLSGNHADIPRWRQEQAVARTRERRPDLVNGEEPEGAPPTGAQRR